jgi:ubiquitin carboxyl-terminal hydrolase 22/27/51
MYSSDSDDPSLAFGPTEFISTIWKIDSMFAGTDQQDSHEFLMFLLNCMHTHHGLESPKKLADERTCKCLAHMVFGGESQSQVTCSGCGKVNRKVELMFDLGLQIRGKAKVVINGNGKNGSVKGSPISPSSAGSSDGDSVGETLQDCLDKYTSVEHLDSTQYTCSNCSTSKGATKQMSIKVLPNVLCLQLKVHKKSGHI